MAPSVCRLWSVVVDGTARPQWMAPLDRTARPSKHRPGPAPDALGKNRVKRTPLFPTIHSCINGVVNPENKPANRSIRRVDIEQIPGGLAYTCRSIRSGRGDYPGRLVDTAATRFKFGAVGHPRHNDAHLLNIGIDKFVRNRESRDIMKRCLGTIAVVLIGVLFATPAEPCSRILWNDNGRAVIVGRNMDWFEDIRSNMWILPRGMERNGLTETNPLRWTSKYGSVIITAYDVGTADGINEKGLAGHMLYLPETSVGSRDESLPGLSMSMWVQYYLDQFATVEEAVKSFESQPFQLRMATEPSSGKPATVHIALNDAKGDSAVIECIEGAVKIYHDRRHVVMTNQPSFDKQLENLRQYRGFGGDKRLPGTHEPADRFVRGAYYVKNLPKPTSDREAIAAMMSVMRNVSAPFGVADPERPNVSTTVWRTVTDLTNGVLYYDSVFSPQVFWVDTKKVNFEADQPVRKLTLVDNFEHSGEVSGQFTRAEMFKFLGPE